MLFAYKTNLLINRVVITAPYCGGATDAIAVSGFDRIADKYPLPICLYDLTVDVNYKITMSVIDIFGL